MIKNANAYHPAQIVKDARGFILGQTLCPRHCLEFTSKSSVRKNPRFYQTPGNILLNCFNNVCIVYIFN